MDDTTNLPSDDATLAKNAAGDAPINAVELALSVIEVLPDSIPTELREKACWIVWRLEPSVKPGDAPRKVPYQAETRCIWSMFVP